MAVVLTGPNPAAVRPPEPRPREAAPPQPQPRPPAPLPPLRDDIALSPGPAGRNGEPSWTLYDPALHRYLRIGRLEFEILCHWGLRHPGAIAAAVSAGTAFKIGVAEVMEVFRFAERASLTVPSGPGGAQRLAGQAAARRVSAAQWLLKNYLFLRVRLVDPDRFLAVLQPAMRILCSGWFLTVLTGLAMVAFYLIGQQWESYTHGFLHLFSVQGAFLVGLALTFAKAIHELGHGLMAKRFGCRVPGMGVALLVLWPMLWTDCTNAWRLTDRRQRLAIDAAGIAAEIVLAVFASLAWCVLPDGPARTAAFLLSGSTWLITVAVNVNPLMRFDGYFLLGDFLDEPNLQDRSFALARWWMREVLFGLRHKPPEAMSPGRRRGLIAYAFACWIYRFGLFLGIAVLVYHLTFKLLGIFLMAVEIGWFIVRPIAAEMRIWRRLAPIAGWTRNAVLTCLAVLAAIALATTPWRTSITAPALLRAARQAPLQTLASGQLIRAAPNGARVTAGEVLFVLEGPDLAHERAVALEELAGIRARLTGQAFDPEEAADLQVTFVQLESALARLRSAEAQAAQLTIRAPFAGVLADVPRDAQTGVWLPRREALGWLIDPADVVVEAEVEEGDVARVHPGAEAWFYPENGEPPLKLTVRSVTPGAIAVLEAPELASIHGGGVAVRQGSDGRLVPEGAVYRTILDMDPGIAVSSGPRRGSVTISGDRESTMSRIWRRAVAVAMREAGP